jgi:hypothetical protein
MLAAMDKDTKKAQTKRANLYIDTRVMEVVEALANSERRSINNMMEALLVEALTARGLVEQSQIPPITLD